MFKVNSKDTIGVVDAKPFDAIDVISRGQYKLILKRIF